MRIVEGRVPEPREGVPDFTVSDDDKLLIVSSVLPTLLDQCATMSSQHVLTADDALDVLAMCAAAIVESDSHLTTPKHHRMAADAVRAHFVGRVGWFRAMREHLGGSYFEKLIKPLTRGKQS